MKISSSATLKVENLRVDFSELVAVDQFSLELHAGDICGLIGPNGAGKTTTFKAIMGIIEMTTGTIQASGISLQEDAQGFKSRIGYMPDDSPLYEDLKVWEYLDHFARAYQIPQAQHRIKQCLELTWLGEKKDAFCSDLSRGMRQRLILAKVLLHDPDVLLLDEPASGLDPNGRIELRKLLLELASMGKTLVVSSHILSELSEFCNQVAIMERGRLVKGGGIREIAQSRPESVIHLKWRNPKNQMEEALSNYPQLRILEIGSNQGKAVFNGSEDQIDELLKTLIAQDIRLTEWRIASADLEQIYIDTEVKDIS